MSQISVTVVRKFVTDIPNCGKVVINVPILLCLSLKSRIVYNSH